MNPPHFRSPSPFSFAAASFFLVVSVVVCSSGDVALMQSSPYPSHYELLASARIAEPQASSLRHGRNPLLQEAFARRRNLAAANSSWQTLTGSPPLVVSRGDNGLLPDQTGLAYKWAQDYGLSNSSALLCDVQITKDGYLICRTGINLDGSTDIGQTLPELNAQLDVNGETVSGFFSINITLEQVKYNITAIQANQARPKDYLGAILTPYDVYLQNSGPILWINVEYPSFYSQNGFDVGSAITSVPNISIAFLSSPEVVFLKDVQRDLANTTQFVLKFRGKNDTEPSTKQSYGSLLSNLTSISSYASGILVPKDYIWSVNNESGLLVSESTLISDAHAANLAIYAYDFVNELKDPSIYNYSFNPILEYLQYAPPTGPNVDGFFTDFPSTASKALACYRSVPSVNQTEKQTLVISHGGASGDYPGCTVLAYEGAVKGGADFIDCPIQITRDGVPICRGSIDLLTNTDITSNSDLVATRTSKFPQLTPSTGVYTFNLTWSEIQTLKAIIDSSDIDAYQMSLNKEYDGQQNILNFTEFLNYAKIQSVNILVDIQYGYFLETEIGVDVVTPVLSALSDAGLENSSRVVIQSEDSAILKRVSETNNYTLAFRIKETNVTINEAVVSEIKALATYATLQRALIQPTFDAYLLNSTGVVGLFHDANMSVFVYYLRNVFVTIPNDYESDPTAEIDTMVQYFKVDGIITTFPATAKAYLGNGCLDLKTEIGGLEYQVDTIQPGAYLTNILPGFYQASAPGLLFDVNKNQTTLPLTVNSTSSTSPSPSPSASPSPTGKNSAAHLHGSTHTSLLIISIIAFQYLVC